MTRLRRREQRLLHEIERELRRDAPELEHLAAILRTREPPRGTGRFDRPLVRGEMAAICCAIAAFILLMLTLAWLLS